jgi:hypothetical protein
VAEEVRKKHHFGVARAESRQASEQSEHAGESENSTNPRTPRTVLELELEPLSTLHFLSYLTLIVWLGMAYGMFPCPSPSCHFPFAHFFFLISHSPFRHPENPNPKLNSERENYARHTTHTGAAEEIAKRKIHLVFRGTVALPRAGTYIIVHQFSLG